MARTDEPAEVRAGEAVDPEDEVHKPVVAREVLNPYGVKVEV
jgi:hypothetical protein